MCCQREISLRPRLHLAADRTVDALRPVFRTGRLGVRLVFGIPDVILDRYLDRSQIVFIFRSYANANSNVLLSSFLPVK